MPAETLDPNFYHRSQTFGGFEWPPQPLWVSGFTFDRATGVLDFSAVPGFDLGRVQEIQVSYKTPPSGTGFYPTAHSRHLYCRPVPPAYGLAEVDGVPVPLPPKIGKVFKVKPDTTDLPADAEILVLYDLTPTEDQTPPAVFSSPSTEMTERPSLPEAAPPGDEDATEHQPAD